MQRYFRKTIIAFKGQVREIRSYTNELKHRKIIQPKSPSLVLANEKMQSGKQPSLTAETHFLFPNFRLNINHLLCQC